LIVVADAVEELVQSPKIVPNPFTPNGDGINDVITFSFNVFLLLEQVQAELDIYDLSGQSVFQLQKQGSTAGNLEFQWDGRDKNGQLAPPGLYIYRLSIDSDQTPTERSGSLSLVY